MENQRHEYAMRSMPQRRVGRGEAGILKVVQCKGLAGTDLRSAISSLWLLKAEKGNRASHQVTTESSGKDRNSAH